jgi:FkbM family methyltransferase
VASKIVNGTIRVLPGIRVFQQGPGFGLYVRLNDPAIGAKVLLRGSHEPALTELLGTLLSPGGVFVDVGANIGYHTLFACARVGPGGRVVAVEPSPDNCDLLRASASRNGFSNLVVHQVAAADQPRVVGFQQEFGSNRQISLSDEGGGIQALTLDEILKGEDRIDVLKIDIEGAEGLAINGARETLARCRPILVTEFFPDLLRSVSGIDPAHYLDTLRACGYTVHLEDGDPAATNAEVFGALDRSRYRHLDLVARPV